MNHKYSTTKLAKKSGERSLLDRVVLILEQARANVVRAVKNSMVTAYWLIGREIVMELQDGDERAEYGKQVIENLSERLTHRYGKGFSAPTLWKFRQFYQAYPSREPTILSPAGRELTTTEKSYPMGGEFKNGFSSQLSWSHYRALMRVAKPDARDFYERETIECCWDKRSLERQIHLIDLKIGEISHKDVRQMDGYVRMFDDQYTYTDDNPTIGLILCAEKNEAVAKYSVLNDRKQIFASKYMLYLPTEKELVLELERERRLIEAHLAEQEQLALSDRDSRAAFLEAENEA